MARIIDNELIGEDNGFLCPLIRISDYVEQRVKENISNFGDSTWLVMKFYLN